MGLSVEKLYIEASMKGGARNEIVRDLSFSVSEGEKLAVVGRSGCGKTMTAMAVLGLLPENCTASGSIRWNGAELLSMDKKARARLRGREHALIPQSGADFLNPSLTIGRQMRESMKLSGVSNASRDGAAVSLLERVGFEDAGRVLASYPFQLSGGMAQRVVMAMSSIGDPGLVIADEPTRGIDRQNTEQFLHNLRTLFSKSAVLLITHDISVAAECDRILVMDEGGMVECGESEQIIHHPKMEYTHKLICDLPHALSHAERGIH